MQEGIARLPGQRLGVYLLALGSLATLGACDTPVRIPGLSFAFPESAPGFISQKRVSESLTIAPSVDSRSSHIGEDIAKSSWEATAADTLGPDQLPKLIDQRLAEAVAKANLFSGIGPSVPQGQWTLSPEIQVFGAQTRGFIGRRVAGLVSIKFTLRRGTVVVWEQVVQRVVTDADPEYTGSFITTVEQAMRRSLADSLRLVLGDAIKQIDKSVQGS